MNNFDYILLENFLKENIDFLKNSRIQKIQQPTRTELIFSVRNLGETRKFYININPNMFHICFMSKENEEKRFIKIPQKPPMFCMLLRKYLESSLIAKIVQPQGERILEFYFETYDETDEKIYLCLAIELMGKHSNIILYNYDTNMIIGCAHNVGTDKSRERELFGGLPYCYPPKAQKKDFKGLSSIFKTTDINSQIDDYFANLQYEKTIKNLKSKIFQITNQKQKHITQTISKIKRQINPKEKTENYRKLGDLIMSNLYNNEDYSKNIEIFDYETNQTIKINLDETKTLKENANRYYKLYTKGKTALEKTTQMIQELELEKINIEQILYSIEECNTYNKLKEIEEEILPNQKAEKIKPSKIDEQIIDNFKIYIGKNNKQNDYIVSKLARPNDLWFHIHNCAGSHILLRLEAGQKENDKIIFECAKLAKKYSIAKNSSKVGIIYTKAKNLKKPPKANLGYVIYQNEQEIIID